MTTPTHKRQNSYICQEKARRHHTTFPNQPSKKKDGFQEVSCLPTYTMSTLSTSNLTCLFVG
jgi:hypothetical protein